MTDWAGVRETLFLAERLDEIPADKIVREDDDAVWGVVVEVGMSGGLDLLAAYANGTARYYNYSGRSIIWEHGDASLDPLIEDVLRAALKILPYIGLSAEPHRPPPATGSARLTILSPEGFAFGEGPLEVLSRDQMAASLLGPATLLMQRLTALAN
ncbi:MAG TPA: hypothetical protein VF407_08595 [Polyangiaceae bacterium]